MSRVGKMPIAIPQGVEVAVTSDQITVKGAGGTLSQAQNTLVNVKKEGSMLSFEAVDASAAADAMSGTMRALVQGTGMAWRISAAALRRELPRSAALQRCLSRYLYVLMAQLAGSATCLHYHLIDQRLARWLLMSHDRAHNDSFHVTHEFLAYMLGVRRVGITMAAGALQRSGLISYHRGELTVLDRAGLEAAACGCYATDRQTYAELLQGKPAADIGLPAEPALA